MSRVKRRFAGEYAVRPGTIAQRHMDIGGAPQQSPGRRECDSLRRECRVAQRRYRPIPDGPGNQHQRRTGRRRRIFAQIVGVGASMKLVIVFGLIAIGFLLLILSTLWVSLFPGSSSWTLEKDQRLSAVRGRIDTL